MQVLVPLDMGGNEIRNVRMQVLAAAPPNPVDGVFYYSSALKLPLISIDGLWEQMVGDPNALVGLVGGSGISVTGTGTQRTISVATAGITPQDLSFDPLARAGHTGFQPIATVTGLQVALDAKEALANKGAANGYAGLDAAGKVPQNQLPAIAITDSFPVASQAEMLALNAQRGDVAIRSDVPYTFILAAEPATILANWLQLSTPAGTVRSVTGTGPITSTGGDTPQVGLAASGITTGYLADNNVTKAKLEAPVRAQLDAAARLLGFTIGDAAATSFLLAHNLNTRDVVTQVRDNAAPYQLVQPDVQMTDANHVTVNFATAPAANAYRVMVAGVQS